MSRPSLNLQDNFLNQVRRENIEITTILLDGSQLVGRVKGFDNFTVVISTTTGGEHLIYKHAIAQLISGQPIVTVPPPRQGGDSRPPRQGGGGGGGGGGRRGGGDSRPPRQNDGGAGDGGGDGRSEAPAKKPAPPKPKEGFNKLDLSALQQDGGGDKASS